MFQEERGEECHVRLDGPISSDGGAMLAHKHASSVDTDGLLTRTTSLVWLRSAAVDLQPAGVGLGVIFEDRLELLLPSPAPFLPRTTLRAAGKSRVEPAPEAQAAEFFVCRSVVIVKDGEDVTTKAMDAFAERFKDQLPQEVICAMRELFHLDDAHATTLEDALI
ncbi:hypothetical protein D1007_37859 [Hordeum vulgare]|nr:hypothetical protein D1007_37859 [Hordeum vulgare]